MIRSLLLVLFLSVNACLIAQYRPSVFFREDWKEIPAEIPVSQKHIANENLTLHLYGAGKDSLKKSHHDQPVDDPYYLWSGLCEDNWAVTFSHNTHLVDLSKFAKIRWRTKQAGFRQLHIILKLEDGTWLVSDKSAGPAADWRVCEIIFEDVSWYELDIEHMNEERPIKEPNLERVSEVGFTDLMRGGISNACSRVDWIEVYGFPVEK